MVVVTGKDVSLYCLRLQQARDRRPGLRPRCIHSSDGQWMMLAVALSYCSSCGPLAWNLVRCTATRR